MIMWVGMVRRRTIWRMGRPEDRSGDLSGLLMYLIGHKRILSRSGITGFFHLFFFWAVVIHVSVVIITQFRFTIPIHAAKILSFVTDILGFTMLLGIIFCFFRRLKPEHNEVSKPVFFSLFLLMIILLAGFFSEGSRIRLLGYPFSWTTPVGWLFSIISPSSPLLMQLMIRVHFFTVLFFIAILPYTFMRHLPADVLNVYYRNKKESIRPRKISLKESPVGARRVSDFTWKQLLDAEACVFCNRCDENCPAFVSNKPLSPQKVVQNILGQMEDLNRRRSRLEGSSALLLEDIISEEEIWSCTTCMACFESCPVYIPCYDKLLDMRRNLVMMEGKFYPELKTFLRNAEIFGDPFGKGKAFREDWTMGYNIKKMSSGDQSDILFWVGCQGAFNERSKLIVASLTQLFEKAGLNYAILGKEEKCCGDPIRRVGNEYLFQEVAKRNIEVLYSLSFNRIVTHCPHCFNMLKKEYPQFGGEFEVFHYTELISDLITRGDLKIGEKLKTKVTYHDPCYLARANDIYIHPRLILNTILSSDLLEPQHSRKNTFCCGAGGGHMWMRESVGDRINDVRLEELLQNGPDIIATSCSYCLAMIEDALRLSRFESVKCMDLVEVLGTL